MGQDKTMTVSTRDTAAMQFLRRTADQNRLVKVKITFRKSRSKKPTGQAGAFAA
jgi:hypothetical protein